MKKFFKRKSVSVEPQDEQNLAGMIDKMQQQLNLLEKKIDTLISQSSQRPSGGNDYSRPFQRFDRSQRFGRGNRENNFRERSFTKVVCADCNKECEVPFKPSGDRPVYCKECFAKRKQGGGGFKAKFEHHPHQENFAKERNFDKPQDRQDRRPGKRKKSSFSRKKK
jgi:CxxC-x17-CxxC domain-containing protein